MSAQVQVPNFASFMPESQKSRLSGAQRPPRQRHKPSSTASRTENVPDLFPEEPDLEMTPLASPESCMMLWAVSYSAAYTVVSDEMRCISCHGWPNVGQEALGAQHGGCYPWRSHYPRVLVKFDWLTQRNLETQLHRVAMWDMPGTGVDGETVRGSIARVREGLTKQVLRGRQSSEDYTGVVEQQMKETPWNG